MAIITVKMTCFGVSKNASSKRRSCVASGSNSNASHLPRGISLSADRSVHWQRDIARYRTNGAHQDALADACNVALLVLQFFSVLIM